MKFIVLKLFYRSLLLSNSAYSESFKWRTSINAVDHALVKDRHGLHSLYLLIDVQWAANGHLNWKRHRDGLVAKEFHQQAGLDFSFRLLRDFRLLLDQLPFQVVLTMVLAKGWSIRQLDINDAFLKGFVMEDIYTKQAPCFQNCQENSLLVL